MLSTGWSRLSTLSTGNTHHLQSLSFFTVLQNAAGQAWSRRAAGNSSYYPTVHDQKLHNAVAGRRNLTGCSSANPPTGTFAQKLSRPTARARIRRERMNLSVHHLHPDSLTEDDVKSSNPGRCTDVSISHCSHGLGTCCVWGDPSLAQYSPTSTAQSSTQRRTLPPATSRAILYRNLTRLSCRIPPVTLPQLMDYHDLHPQTQSTRSYNFLIGMAIRTASFETHKLVIRWQIRIGAWDAAWQTLTASRVLQSTNDGNDGAGWPDSLWLEFFGSLKRRSIRRKGVVMEEPNGPFVVYAQRVIHSIAYILLQLQEQEQALRLVQTYFSYLPAQITPKFSEQCLDIIHILVVFGSRSRGLKKFHEHRKILTSLLAYHPSFRPTSTTLFLLLGSLRGALRSGALASECLASFKRRWGAGIEDHRVRLRIASLALKQGRLDISSDILADARLANEHTSSLNEPAIGHGERYSSRRPRFKSIFRGTGKLVAHQIRLEKRVRAKKCRKTYEIQNTKSSS
ncbi:hypothetical protein C8J55DRAFT_29144 [Lentinula edodes]|uniref:Uncharacterized protein n=1 Tax=Lentinula lateritia TaxID=40482 RepID=A0A9W9AKD0_9AGAR|nr:hypothetical protein C8J55DRAFT_29144 [Lentinula edodes]